MPPHPSTNFEIQKYYQNDAQLSLKNKPKFTDVYSRNNLPKMKDGAYVINLDEDESIGFHWIALYANVNNIIYFDSFGAEFSKRKSKRS